MFDIRIVTDDETYTTADAYLASLVRSASADRLVRWLAEGRALFSEAQACALRARASIHATDEMPQPGRTLEPLTQNPPSDNSISQDSRHGH